MTFVLPSYLWKPQSRGVLETISSLEAGLDTTLFSPTGGGKTEQAIQLLNWALSKGQGGCFYVNRTLLIGQTAARFDKAGLPYGIRAAGYDDRYDFSAPFQIVSSDTEYSRVFERNIWTLHPSWIVIVDEAHLQKCSTMQRIIAGHKENGAKIVLLTATPIGLSHLADKLVISGTMKEYRECKALVPAIVRSIEQPDMSKVKRNKTGEYVLDGEKKAIYTQSIVGNVIASWKKYNPDARPTMLYAPGKAESVWFTQKFMDEGVNWCHVDATDAIVDGKRARLTRDLWTEILARFKAGEIRGLSSRFKLREGIDVPEVYHCILATPIGSLASYVQTIGRVLRYSAETPDNVLVTDHGGNYLRHGSPNVDRDWLRWWSLPEHVISEWHQNQIREGKQPEPIRCPRCEAERLGGIKCPQCGYEHAKSQRKVIMENGTLVEHEGHLIPPRKEKLKPDTQQLWNELYFSWIHSRKAKYKSFSQLIGFFAHLHHYHPPKNLVNMPIRDEDWCRPVSAVAKENLNQNEVNNAT